MQGSFLWKSHSLNRHMVLPLASFDLTSSANIENASEHASSQSRPQRKSLPIACAGYVFASEKTKPSLRCNRSFPIGPLPDRKSSIHSMCSESSMLHAAPMFDIIPQIHQTRIVANLPRGKKRGHGWGCFGGMRSDGEKDGSDPISTRRHFAERLDGTGKM